MSTKGSVILIGWPVLLISASLIINTVSDRALPMGAMVDALIVFYALSNAVSYSGDESPSAG